MTEIVHPYFDTGIRIDIGTGDGAFVYKSARTSPNQFFVGIDSNADNLAKYSRKTRQKPAKGGVKNALFVQASIEALPEELNGLATHVSILFPWGSLLKTVATPDVRVLQGLHRICRADAELRIVFGYNHRREPGVTAALGLPLLSLEYLQTMVRNHYTQAGFAIQACQLEKSALRDIPTTWAQRLAYGKDREFFELRGRVIKKNQRDIE